MSSDQHVLREGACMILRSTAPGHLMLLLIFGVGGCSGTAVPHTVHPELARETLIAALTAWKDGSSAEDLQARTPAIVVQDMDWTAGAALQGFELQGDGMPIGANLSIEVELTLADQPGEVSTRKVWYLVGTDPVLTVFRDMLH